MGHMLSPAGQADVDELAYYIALQSGGLEIAHRFLESIYRRFLVLGTYPRAGRQRDDLRPGVRMFPAGEYVILYRIVADDALILRVVHGSRDLQALLESAAAE